MISGILANILGYTLFISLILFLLGSGIYLIITGIREYLEDAENSLFYLFGIILGCICIIIAAMLILKTFGL